MRNQVNVKIAVCEKLIKPQYTWNAGKNAIVINVIFFASGLYRKMSICS
jgi:hypothetical protein